MGENDSMEEKNLAKEEQKEDQIKKAIEIAIFNDKSEVLLKDGQSVIKLNLINTSNSEEDETFDIMIDEDTRMAQIQKNKDGKIKYNYYNSALREKIPSSFDLERARIVIEEAEKARENKKTPDEVGKDLQRKSNALQREIEQGIKQGYAKKMEIDREVSTTENMGMFISRAFGVKSKEIYRVQDKKDPHKFKYVAKTYDSEEPYQEINISTASEGRNSGQKVWVMQNGQLKEKAVDSLLLRGRYGIATDIPDGPMNDNTRTFLVTRTPDGKYLAIAAGEKYGTNRNTSGDKIQKEFMSRSRSVYEIDDTIEAAQLAEKIYGLTKDGKLTTNEIAMVKHLKIEKNMDDNEIKDIVNAICTLKDMGYSKTQIRDVIEDVRKAPTDKDVAMKLAKQVDNEKERGDGEKRLGENPLESPRTRRRDA